MKFACLVYVDMSLIGALSPADSTQLTDDSIAYDWEVQHSGGLILAQPLAAPASAVTVRIRNGKLSRTDGPYAETKEFLGGFSLIEAPDLEEAVRIIERSPMARMGSIEIRPFLEQSHSQTGQKRPPLRT